MGIKLNLTIIGDEDTGKTQLVYSYNNINSEPNPTIGAQYYKIDDYIDCCWDMSGHARYANLYPLYYRNAQAFILVFDLTNQKSFQNIEGYIRKINQCCVDKPLIILVGNKEDLSDQRVVSSDDINKLTQKLEREKHRIFYRQTSALNGTGVDNVFAKIADIFTKDPEQPIKELEPSDEEMAAIYAANRRDEFRAVKNASEQTVHWGFFTKALVKEKKVAEADLINTCHLW